MLLDFPQGSPPSAGNYSSSNTSSSGSGSGSGSSGSSGSSRSRSSGSSGNKQVISISVGKLLVGSKLVARQ